MYQRKLKPFVIPLIYSMVVLTFITSIYFLRSLLQYPVSDKTDKDFIYVTSTIFSRDILVVGTDKVIVRPYTDNRVKIVKYFYDYQDEPSRQEESIIYYENTYMQNSGVDYSGPETFDVVAILDGSVINVTENKLLGKVIEVRHSNEFISVYQSLSETKVNKGDIVNQGQIIGVSGKSILAPDLGEHLHFEILYKGKVVDPETFYDKTINDL